MTLDPWVAKAAVLLSSIVMVVIRAPHGQRSRGVKVAKSGKGPLEIALLTVAWPGFFVPLFWVATPWLAFALGLLFALRVGPEERMMREEFGADYEAYIARTKRLVPGIW